MQQFWKNETKTNLHSTCFRSLITQSGMRWTGPGRMRMKRRWMEGMKSMMRKDILNVFGVEITWCRSSWKTISGRYTGSPPERYYNVRLKLKIQKENIFLCDITKAKNWVFATNSSSIPFKFVPQRMRLWIESFNDMENKETSSMEPRTGGERVLWSIRIVLSGHYKLQMWDGCMKWL